MRADTICANSGTVICADYGSEVDFTGTGFILFLLRIMYIHYIKGKRRRKFSLLTCHDYPYRHSTTQHKVSGT